MNQNEMEAQLLEGGGQNIRDPGREILLVGKPWDASVIAPSLAPTVILQVGLIFAIRR
jgi:hypothetical protein